MKKTLPTTAKARSLTGWHKHLRPEGKRAANKGTRKLGKLFTKLAEALDKLP